jgi:hypothetical protein
MASIQVSFETVKEIWEEINWSDHFAYGKPTDKLTWKGELMITFEQVTKIEALRRQIENLQNSLSAQANWRGFAWQGVNDNWIKIDPSATPIIREALCKFSIAKIIKLLDESERLGVDVSTSKQTLLEFLEEIKPKQETT